MLPESLPFLYRDSDLLVAAKPAGLLVHRTKIDFHEPNNLVDALSRHLDKKVYPVHRLDKPTSGLLIFALNPDTARKLSVQFEHGEIQKSYIAVVRGYTQPHGRIEHSVKDKDKPRQKRVPATTTYTTLRTIELPYRVDRYPTTRYSLLTIEPITGRRHQIRQHMKHIHHPLVGDTSYGKTLHNQLFCRVFKCNRLLLHASMLKFRHPGSDEVLTVGCDPTDRQLDGGQFARVLSDRRWRAPANTRSDKLLL